MTVRSGTEIGRAFLRSGQGYAGLRQTRGDAMADREYSLVDIIRDPGAWVYEALELSQEGHFYLYRYDAGEELFSRATVPAGAASVHFHPLAGSAKVPIGGWVAVERKNLPVFRPRLVAAPPFPSP